MVFSEAAMALHRQAKRRNGSHGVSPLSAATRKRLLGALLQRAEGGDVPAAEALIRLSFLRHEVSATRCLVAGEPPA